MYKTCMFCNKPLGTNEVIETFPVGRRLAFDAARGRLWVVCRKCERWNLTPLEERWEAVEMCEKIFSETRLRVSTENVGLAKHPEGLVLVRIGEPMRPEFAAWRYGDQFGRRRKRQIMYGVAASAAIGGIVIGGIATGLLSGVALSQAGNFWNLWANGRTLVKHRRPDGRLIKLKRMDLLGTRVRASDDELGFKVEVRQKKKKEWFEGDEARRIVGAILPKMNKMGGKPKTVQEAVVEIEALGHPNAFLRLGGWRPLPRQEGHPRLHQQDAQADQARARNGAARRAGAACAGGRALATRARMGGGRGDRGDLG